MVDRRTYYGMGRIYDPLPVLPQVISAPLLDDAAKTAITGTQVDDKFAAQIIGKDQVIWVGGQALIGCRIIEGPFIVTDTGNGFVDMIVYAAVNSSPGTTIELRSIRLNGTESFTSDDGGATWVPVDDDPGPSVFADVDIEVRYGTEDQTSFASSIVRYGSRAVPYRPRICVELKNIPLSLFNNEIPFVSVYVYEASSLSRREGITKLARYARYDDSEFDINVSDSDTFWIVAQQSTFIEFLQGLQRTIGRNWNIVASDKLYVFENSATETPIPITRDDIVEDTVRFGQVDPGSIPAVRYLSFVDTGRDNAINTAKAKRNRFPIALTSSRDSEEIEIPVGMTFAAAQTAVNKSMLIDQWGLDRFACKLLPHMRGIEPGDLIEVDVGGDLTVRVWRVLTVVRNAADWTIEITAEHIKMSLLPTGPTITSDSTITVDEGETAVVTVTSDQEGTFSIVGGDDASLFTIDPDTGDLEFLSPPNYEAPSDADTDNDYEVIVQVLATSGLSGTQIITVTVTNVLETPGEIFGPNFLIIV